ncbi:MAG TPA: hypothetical protein VKU86_13675 [Acidimicrobiales bacterium]|nr:hypothetical protein [Acidimicrobiales bacterium]
MAFAGFVGVMAVRGGPGFADAVALTRPTTAVAHGHWREAAVVNYLPQPLGYPLLASPFVAALGPVVGSGTWCTDSPALPQLKIVRDVWPPCSGPNVFDAPPKPPWYRSQGVLGLLAWALLAFGAVQLLRAAGAGRGLGEVALVGGLVAVPAASDGLVEAFHPQDLVCVGLLLGGVALGLRRRWAAAGAVFGVAFVCKQFALLALVAALAAAPGWRARARLAGSAVGVAAVAILPFAVVAPAATYHSLVAVAHFSSSEITSTVVGMTSWDEFTKLAVARDGPVVLALVLAAGAWWRARERLLEPVPLLGLAVACLGARLVFEVVNTSYYLLAVSVLLVTLDVAARRVPYRSVAWIAVMRWWVNPLGGHQPSWGAAAVFAAGAVTAVVLGLAEIPRRSRPAPAPASPTTRRSSSALPAVPG